MTHHGIPSGMDKAYVSDVMQLQREVGLQFSWSILVHPAAQVPLGVLWLRYRQQEQLLGLSGVEGSHQV